MVPIIIYFIILNIIGLFSMRIDKQKAIHKKWRIPESTLFMIAILGGSLGSLIGLKRFRHKTNHCSFTIGIPFILMIQIVGGLCLYYFL